MRQGTVLISNTSSFARYCPWVQRALLPSHLHFQTKKHTNTIKNSLCCFLKGIFGKIRTLCWLPRSQAKAGKRVGRPGTGSWELLQPTDARDECQAWHDEGCRAGRGRSPHPHQEAVSSQTAEDRVCLSHARSMYQPLIRWQALEGQEEQASSKKTTDICPTLGSLIHSHLILDNAVKYAALSVPL